MFHSVHFHVKYGEGCVSFLILIKLITNKLFFLSYMARVKYVMRIGIRSYEKCAEKIKCNYFKMTKL